MSMHRNVKTVRRTRGAAMLLVLIAVAMCTIMALSFLAAQEPTAVVASNIDRKTQARAIAESALKMAIDYVNEDADWRSDKSSGVWMSDITLDGGTFTLTGTDEEDGDLADDNSEAVLLSVVASYEGVTHRVSALVTPGAEATSTNRLLLVAGNGSSPSSTDQAKRDIFASWGYTVTLIDDSASSSSYDAAVAVNDVVYVSEEVNSGSVSTKLRDVTIGVVNDEPYLHDDFGFSSTNSGSGVSSDSIDIVDTSHPITADFTAGSLIFHNGSINVRYITGSMPSGMTILADAPGSGTQPNLAVADVGDTLRYGPAAGRRVIFLSTGDLNVNNLNTDGQLLLKRCIEWAAGGGSTEPTGVTPTLLALYEFNQVTIEPTLAGRWPLDEQPIAGAGGVSAGDKIEVKDSGRIDSYDSSAGSYASQSPGSNAIVTTNSTSSDKFKVSGSGYVGGDGYIGSGGNTSSVFDVDGTLTGSKLIQDENLTISTLSAPSGMPGSSGNFSKSSGNTTISSDKTYDKFTLSSSATVTISGDVTIWVKGDFEMGSSSELVIPDGSSLTLYTGDDLDVESSAILNGDSGDPSKLTIYGYGYKHVDLKDSAEMAAIVYTNDELHIKGSTHFYGKVLAADKVKVEDSAELHYDLSLGGFSASGSGGAAPAATADTSPLANEGTVHGGPSAGVTGQHGTAFEFDGDDDYVEVPHDDSYLMQAGTFSVWFKTDKNSGRQGLFSKDSTSFDTGGHFSVFLDGDRVEVRMQSTTQSYYVYSPSSSINTGQWYHIMFAWGEAGMALYLDGVLVDTDEYTGGLGTTSGGIGNYEPIVLGGNAWQSGDLVATPVKDHFEGTLDDLRIYNERLTESQALEIFNGAVEPSPFQSESIVEDTSGYGDPLTLSITQTDEVSWASGALTFTGDAHATSLMPATKLHDAIAANGAFAVELIMQRASPGTTASPSRIISYADGASAHNFMLGQDDTHYEARVRDTATGTNGTLSPEFISGTAMGSGQTHVVLSYNEGEVSVFLDGVLDETNTAGGTLSNWDDAFYLVLGGAYGGGSHWQGTLSRVAIYDNAFNAIQANNVFNGSDPGSGESGVAGTGSVKWDEQD